MYKLRLVNENAQEKVFFADHSSLSSRLHAAFLEFRRVNGVGKALLELHHREHGWNQVYDCNAQYVIINSPVNLEYSRLAKAIAHTQYRCDSWPTERERQQLKNKRMREERALTAEARRNAFKVVE